jgi:hypothetical protein
MPDYGFDTSSQVTNSLANTAVTQFGNGFWIRYFSPSPAAHAIDTSSTNAQSEKTAMHNYGAHHLAPVSEPYQYRLGTTGSTGTSYGTHDATIFVDALKNVRSWAGLTMPPALFCYLGLEASSPLSSAYWNAWARYINTYQYGGSYPFYAGLYCSPRAAPPNCSIIHAAPPVALCFGVWSSEPEPCSECTERFSNRPWDAYDCSGFTTMLWQYAEKGSCRSVCGKTIEANVDLDAATIEHGALGTMFSF